MNEIMDFTTSLGKGSCVSVGCDAELGNYHLEFSSSDSFSRSRWRMNMNEEQAQRVCSGMMEILGIIPIKKNREKIREAIRKAECVEFDHSGMSDQEIKELDDALDLIFTCARFLSQEEKHG